MAKAEKKGSSSNEKEPLGPTCSNCGEKMVSKAGAGLVCTKCGNEERGD